MALLQPSEYDKSYFDGIKGTYRHNAGYGVYERWYRKDGPNSLGEFWKDMAEKYRVKFDLTGKKILEIGCAKGFVVEDLRELGVDAYGIDVSSYVIGEASKIVAPYLSSGDARTVLSQYSDDEFDTVFSLRFLECIAEVDLPDLISEMNRISRFQFHDIDEHANPNYYLNHPLSWWKEQGFAKNTILVAHESKKEVKV